MEWGTVVTTVLGIFGTVLTGFGTVLGILWRDTKAATAAHLACEVKHAKLEGTIEGFKRELDVLRALTKDEKSHGTWVVCDYTGLIVDLGGKVVDLLGYRPTELVGKNIDILVPDKYKDAHHKGLERIAKGGTIRELAVSGEAVKADKTTAKVVINLSATSYRGQECLRAEIFELSP